ncbi:hypothetical protein LCGC14_3058470 [marine sediment metagenome]|uniref:Uncharacterized protein n=1 Tax=marine sediment metagenome TaxID=412755 RepID=A0A0F8WK61_9ZZZZ
MYKIEKNIPIPKSRWRERKYPFPKMKIGDSFFVPLNGRKTKRVQPSIVSAGHRYQNQNKRFTTRIIIKKDVEIGIGCWCVKRNNQKGGDTMLT